MSIACSSLTSDPPRRSTFGSSFRRSEAIFHPSDARLDSDQASLSHVHRAFPGCTYPPSETENLTGWTFRIRRSECVHQAVHSCAYDSPITARRDFMWCYDPSYVALAGSGWLYVGLAGAGHYRADSLLEEEPGLWRAWLGCSGLPLGLLLGRYWAAAGYEFPAAWGWGRRSSCRQALSARLVRRAFAWRARIFQIRAP